MPSNIYSIVNYTEDAITVFELAYQDCNNISDGNCIKGITFTGTTVSCIY